MAEVAFGSLEKIVKVALAIKEAVETVKQNDKECRAIEKCATRCTALLKRLKEQTDIMKDEAMRGPLEDVTESLEEALELVKRCQRKHYFSFMRFNNYELSTATNNFSDENIIGGGGAATVYKSNYQEQLGVVRDGQEVAIKKVFDYCLADTNERSIYDGINVFINLEHKNIIRPLGYCHEIVMVLCHNEGKYIGAHSNIFCFVEKYMPNGSMKSFIKGMFSLGYMAPEYLGEGILSTKCDVYAFGMILNQTISSLNRSKSRYRHFVGWAELAEDARRMETFGPAPAKVDQSQLMEIKRCIEVGSLCTQFDRHERPTMTEVLQMLSGSSKK
ncbi:hypothetical protein EJB05_57456, partial [Eragrostis curvula]